MKRIILVPISLYLIIKLITSCATKELYDDSSPENLNGGSDQNIPLLISPFPLDILPPSLGVQYYRDGIVFLSDSKNEEKISSGHVSFGQAQAYYAPFGDSTLGQHINFSPKTPFLYPCDAVTFSDDFGTMYFTKPSETDNLEKIYRAENFMIGDLRQQWTYGTDPLEFCKEGSIYTHPAISSDASFMIFSSNNQGSTGGMDLFIARNIDMRWSEPQNLGELINTSGNEIFPSLDRNNNLYFSSDGRQGQGGYDVYLCYFDGKEWGIPVNAKNQINTKNDEFAFTIDRNSGKSAFFTSRKTTRNADPQLYNVAINKNLSSNAGKDLTHIIYGINVDSSAIKLLAKRREIEKMRADSIEAARIRAEKTAAEKFRNDSIAAAKLAEQKLRLDRQNAIKFRNDSIAAAKLAAQKLQAEKAKAEKLRNDSIAAAKLEARKLEAQRIAAASKLKADSIEAERLRAERIRTEKMNAEKRKADSIATQKLIAQKREAERTRLEKLRNDSIAAAKLTAQKAEAERLRAEQLRVEKRKSDSLTAVKLAAQKIEAERLKAEKRKSDSIAFAKLTLQQKEAERIKALNKRKADSLEAERIKAENLKAEKLRIERFRADSLAAARLKENERLKKDEVYYKVQILSTVKPRGDFEVTINGVKYQAQQYFYLKEYRYVIGAFRSVDPARELQYKARSSGWPQAFVAAFKNGERSLDKELFK
jgi:hypothetical protein